MVNAIVGARICIPIAQISERQERAIVKSNRLRFYEEKACAKCEYVVDRHSPYCDSCPAFTGDFKLYKYGRIDNVDYLMVPVGSKHELMTMVPGIKFDYRNSSTDFKREINFNWDVLRPEQKKAVKAMLENKRGILEAPPRSGKTPMSSAAICYIGKKTLILAAQYEWLAGFRNTLLGKNNEGSIFCDATPDQVGLCKKLADFQKYDICLATYQSFLRNDKLLAQIRSMFHVVVIDEVQGAAALGYARILAQINARYMFGLSGTPYRKDMRESIFYRIIGARFHKVVVERLRPTVKVFRTGFKAPTPKHGVWAHIVSRLERDKKRVEIIAAEALKDATAGHMVLIPLAGKKAIREMTAEINRQAGRTVAHAFTGDESKAYREQLIDKASEFKIRILVGTLKLLSVGTNIPRASMLYEVTLSSNKYNADQRVSRVLTPWEGKPDPVVKIFIDEYDIRRACLRNEWFQKIKPTFNPLISPTAEAALVAYLNKGRNDYGYKSGA